MSKEQNLEDKDKALRIGSVNKPFYCFEKDDKGRKCKSQCDICGDSKLKPN